MLSQPDFWVGTREFVRIKLEYPGREDQFRPERRAAYVAWRDRFGIRAYPTVMLADPAGRPYAVTGFEDKEDTPARFVARVDRLRPTLDRRDAALARASALTGINKARALDEALAAVRAASDPGLARYHGEMVVRFYRPEIDAVIALDPDNAVGLRERYSNLLAAADEQFRFNRFVEWACKVRLDQSPQDALVLIEA